MLWRPCCCLKQFFTTWRKYSTTMWFKSKNVGGKRNKETRNLMPKLCVCFENKPHLSLASPLTCSRVWCGVENLCILVFSRPSPETRFWDERHAWKRGRRQLFLESWAWAVPGYKGPRPDVVHRCSAGAYHAVGSAWPTGRSHSI